MDGGVSGIPPSASRAGGVDVSGSEPTVFVVEDDDAVRDALSMLIRSVGLAVETFVDARAFLNAYKPARPGCLVLDVRMPGMSGLELQESLTRMGSTLPIVFVTGHGDVPIAVNAMRSGAVNFLQKPFDEQELLDSVHHSIDQDATIRRRLADRKAILDAVESLTPREREVMEKIVDGAPNKAVAYDLSVSERTVEIHRSRAMKKMRAESLAELVQMVMRVRR
jgi:FixJ family two-component response regulator